MQVPAPLHVPAVISVPPVQLAVPQALVPAGP
jgi:hypothetical protein